MKIVQAPSRELLARERVRAKGMRLVPAHGRRNELAGYVILDESSNVVFPRDSWGQMRGCALIEIEQWLERAS